MLRFVTTDHITAVGIAVFTDGFENRIDRLIQIVFDCDRLKTMIQHFLISDMIVQALNQFVLLFLQSPFFGNVHAETEQECLARFRRERYLVSVADDLRTANRRQDLDK